MDDPLPDVPPDLLQQIKSVRAKRPRTVLEHILEHGSVTTDELKELYGYNHPPRAARDVRELGIPLRTLRVAGPDGRKIAAYTLDLELAHDASKAGGRRAFPKELKDQLLGRDGSLCSLCGAPFPATALQVDHRVPYEVVGDRGDADPSGFMLVCGSCNRAKSWSCEQCVNWTTHKDPAECTTCMWASPDRYAHIALEQRRSVTLNWVGEDTIEYDDLARRAAKAERPLSDFMLELLRGAGD